MCLQSYHSKFLSPLFIFAKLCLNSEKKNSAPHSLMADNQMDPLTLFQNNQLPTSPVGIVVEDEEQTPNTPPLAAIYEDMADPVDVRGVAALHEDIADPVYDRGVQGQNRGRRELCNEDRHAAYAMLLQKSVNGKLKRTSTTEVAQFFNVHIRSIQRLWKSLRCNV